MMGDFNVDKNLKDFCQFYILKHLVEVPFCYKYPNNPLNQRSYVSKLSLQFPILCGIEQVYSNFIK